MALTTIPARRGKAALAKKGQHVRVVNTHGSQVVDTWAFVAGDPAEFMSMEHTRANLEKLVPDHSYYVVGDNRSMPEADHYKGTALEHKIVGKVLF